MEDDCSDHDRRSSISNGPSVKIAGLWKRSQGLRKFTKPNWRHRVFILTEQALSYYSGTLDRIGSIKGRIAIESIKAIEYVDHLALGLAHTLQIIYQTKKHGYVTLYITGRDKEECEDWVISIRQACYFNQDMLMHYHPGAFLRDGWSCCHKRLRPTLGCQPTYYLLTRSSSRYAEMRRLQRASRRDQQARPYSTLHRPSAASDSNPNPAHSLEDSGRSSSYDDLHMARQCSGGNFRLVNFGDAPTHVSMDTISTVNGSHKNSPAGGIKNDTASKTKNHSTTNEEAVTDSVEPSSRKPNVIRKKCITVSDLSTRQQPRPRSYERKLSNPEGKNRHQIAPLTPLVLSHRLNSIDSSNETTPPPSSKKLLYVGGSRSSSISGGDCDYHCYSWPRKVSIQPRISDTDPDLIHV